jgi:hypothetical protein
LGNLIEGAAGSATSEIRRIRGCGCCSTYARRARLRVTAPELGEHSRQLLRGIRNRCIVQIGFRFQIVYGPGFATRRPGGGVIEAGEWEMQPYNYLIEWYKVPIVTLVRLTCFLRLRACPADLPLVLQPTIWYSR